MSMTAQLFGWRATRYHESAGQRPNVTLSDGQSNEVTLYLLTRDEVQAIIKSLVESLEKYRRAEPDGQWE